MVVTFYGTEVTNSLTLLCSSDRKPGCIFVGVSNQPTGGFGYWQFFLQIVIYIRNRIVVSHTEGFQFKRWGL